MKNHLLGDESLYTLNLPDFLQREGHTGQTGNATYRLWGPGAGLAGAEQEGKAEVRDLHRWEAPGAGWQLRFGEPQGRQGMGRWMERWLLSFIRPLSLKQEVVGLGDLQVPRGTK